VTTPHPLDQRMPRIDALTGMRWWAAFYVFTYHMLVFAPLPQGIADFLIHGDLGVTFFFVLSGFVLTWSASPKVSQSTFYVRRFARIYPSHFVALLLAIPVFYSFNPAPEQWWVKPVDVGILALSFVLLQGWSRDPVVLFSGNPAAWTLTCEMFFYALHPYVSKLLTRLGTRGSLIFAGAAVSFAVLYRLLALLFPGAWFAILPLPLTRVTEFATGMGLAWAFRCGWRPRLPVTVALVVILGSLAAFAYLPVLAPTAWITHATLAFFNEIFIVACAVVIVALAARSLSGRRTVFASRVMVLLGEWSFTFYLLHATIMYFVLEHFGARTPGWQNLGWYAVFLLLALVAAAGLHYGVERPLERRLRAWKENRAAVA